CAWIGNSALIAQKHYLQVTDADFKRAAKGGAAALQKPVQQGTAPGGTGQQETPEVLAGCGSVRDSAVPFNDMQDIKMAKVGLEPTRPKRTRAFAARIIDG